MGSSRPDDPLTEDVGLSSDEEAGAARGRRSRRRRSRSSGRAGRDLPVAIAVSLLLGGLIIASLYTVKVAFLALLVASIGLAIAEMVRSLATCGVRVPYIPVGIGAVAMLVGAYLGGGTALTVAMAFTALAVLVWRMPDGAAGYVRDITSGIFVALYVPFLAGFASLLLVPDDGADRVLIFIVVTICSDVGGYATGVLFGRHPMAPRVSPRKTWEGFVGSALACMGGGAALVFWLLDGAYWQGAALGAALLTTATLGDLGESMIKRDLGIKDMGNLLPAHGGIMDRLDSLLPSAPVAWLLLTIFVPPV